MASVGTPAPDILNKTPPILVPQNRELVYRQPIGAQSYTNTSQDIKINLDNGIVDLRKCWFQMDAVMANSGAGTGAFPWPFPCIFQRLRLYAWNKLVVDIQDYAFIHGMFAGQREVDAATTIDRDGSSTGSTRFTQSATLQTYLFRLESDALKRLYPAYALGGANMQIVLNMSLPQSHAEIGGGASLANLSTTISNIYFYYHLIEPTPTVKQVLDAQIATGWKLYFDNWTTQAVTQVGATTQTTNLPFKNVVTKAIMVYGIPTADLTSGIQVTPGGKYVNDAPNTNLVNVQLKGGSMVWPQVAQDFTTAASYKMMQLEMMSVLSKWTGTHYRNNSSFVTQSTVQANAFTSCLDMRLDSSPAADDYLQNGWNASGAVNLVYQQRYSASPGNQTQIFMCLHEDCLTVGPAQAYYEA